MKFTYYNFRHLEVCKLPFLGFSTVSEDITGFTPTF